MSNTKNGTRVFYKAACAVIFLIFCFIYLYYYQTDIMAAGQHLASGGKTQYEPVIGTALILIALKLLQNGIQAVVKLKGKFFALTYFPSFLILAMLTDLPSGADKEITFGAWVWALPLLLIVWAVLVYFAKQYQSIESSTRGEGILSQDVGINFTLLLAMIIMVCLIGNHNRLFHQRMHVENLISRKEYKEAVAADESYKSDDKVLTMLRVYALAQQKTIGSELFKAPLNGTNSIIPSDKETYTVIIPFNHLIETYKRNADWQLCQMLVSKNLDNFYGHLLAYYGLGATNIPSDSTSTKPENLKAQAKLNAYKDSLLSIKYQNLPRHYQEALVLYNAIKGSSKHPIIKQNYLNESLVKEFDDFRKATPEEKEKRFGQTYWMFYVLKSTDQ